METVVYAEKRFRKNREPVVNVRSIGFMFIASLAGIFIFSPTVKAETLHDLNERIAALESAVDADSLQGLAVVDAIQAVVAPSQSLTVGTVGIRPAGTVNLTVHYKASTAPVSAMQFDLVLPQGITVQSVTAGLAAQAAGKSVQGSPVSTGHRVLIFGLNQTIIPSGSVAVLSLQSSGTVNPGKQVLSLTNVSASSPTGTPVPLTLRNGSVTVQ